MTTYNTGNPLGSSDPRDLHDNAENLDEAVNSDGDTFQDRLGNSRLTWTGIVKAGSGDPAIAVDAAARAVDAAGRAENAEAVVDAANIKAEVDRAEAARDAAFINADVYPDVETGNSSVDVGEQFQVLSEDGLKLIRYEKGSSGSNPVADFMSTAGIYRMQSRDTYPDITISVTEVNEIKREWIAANIVAGQEYTVFISADHELKVTAPYVVSISISTTLQTDNVAIDSIFSTSYMSAGVTSVTFTATENASFLYLYIRAADPVNVSLSLAEPSTSQLGINTEALRLLMPPSFNIYYVPTGGRSRYIYRQNFVKDHSYRLSLVFSDSAETSSGVGVAFSVKALSGYNYLDSAFTIVNDEETVEKGHRVIDFVATDAAPTLQFYMNLDRPINLSIALIDTTNMAMNAEHIDASRGVVDKYLGRETHKIGSHSYSGKLIDLKNNKYSFRHLKKIQKPSGQTNAIQGSTLRDDKLIVLFHTGAAAVYDFSSDTTTPLASFNLGSHGPDNHANCANFSSEFYGGNAQFPLLYVTDGNSPAEMRCSVENISEVGGVYSSEKVQEINFSNEGFGAAGLEDVWGWPNWLVDAENGFLYAFSARYRTTQVQYYDQNIYIANKFRLPKIADGEVITLGVDDLIEQKLFEYNVNITQSGCIVNNKIVYVFGLGNAQHPFEIRVYDLLGNSLSSSISPPISSEPESCFVKDGKLYVLCITGDIYEFEF